MRALGLAAFAAVLFSQVAVAQTGTQPEHHYYGYGIGMSTCGKWTQDHTDNGPARVMGLVWVEGFVSAAEPYSGYNFKETDSGGMTGYIDNYCAAHPLDTVMKAASGLILELVKQ